jgi:ATP-dependent Clp protease ATP-binding subunit ClpE
LNEAISEKGLHLAMTDDVKQELVNLGYNPEMGARPLRRVIQEHLEDQIADFYLDNPEVKNLLAKMDDGQIVITAQRDSDKNMN